jgi:hypothetical protein
VKGTVRPRIAMIAHGSPGWRARSRRRGRLPAHTTAAGCSAEEATRGLISGRFSGVFYAVFRSSPASVRAARRGEAFRWPGDGRGRRLGALSLDDSSQVSSSSSAVS